jgi:hypothetical protein
MSAPVLEPLLRWANNHTRGHSHIHPIEDYDETLASGLGFCALVYAYFPDKIPINELKAETKEDRIRNFNLAFDVAKEMMGAERYLDASDMLEIRDKKSIMVWMSEVWNCCKEKELVPKFQPSASWNSSYEVKEAQRRNDDLRARALARMRGDQPPAKAGVTPGKVKGKWNPHGKKNDSDDETAPAKSPGAESPREEEKKPESPSSPAAESAPPAAAPMSPRPSAMTTPGGIKFDITGRSAKGGTAGSSCQFTVKLKLDDKAPAYSSSAELTVHVEGPSQPKITVQGSAGWSYVIICTPTVEGQYWFDFVFKGEKWTDQPFLLPVEKGKKVPDFPYQGTKRLAANPDSS